MLKAGLIITFSLTFFSGYAQIDSLNLTNYTSNIINHKKEKNNTLKTIIYTTGYAVVTLLCYRYLDTDIKNFAQANQNKTITDIATTRHCAKPWT